MQRNRDKGIGIREFFSGRGVFTVRNLAVMAMLLAFTTILAMPGLTIYLSPTFKAISFSYLPGVLAASMFGPLAALVYGAAADTLGYIVNPAGAYFPGYALSEMVTYFIFACLLYKREITFARVIIAHAAKLVIVIFGLNYLWMNMMMGTLAGSFFTGVRLLNNLVQFPFHVLLIVLIGKQVIRLKGRYLAQ